MNNLSNNVLFVISAFKGNNPMADSVYTNELEDILKDKGDTYIRSEGKWNGKEEEVFILTSPAGVGHDIVKATLLELADVFNQECIAEIDSNNSGLYLHYTNGETQYAGKFTLSENKPTEDYTLINGLYLSLVN